MHAMEDRSSLTTTTVKRDLGLTETKFGEYFLEALSTEVLIKIVEYKAVKIVRHHRASYIAAIKNQVSGLRELLQCRAIPIIELERLAETFLHIEQFDPECTRATIVNTIHDVIASQTENDG